MGVVVLVMLGACAPEHRLQPQAPLLTWNLPLSSPGGRPAQALVVDVPPSYMVLLPDADGRTGQVMFNSSRGRQTLNQPRQGVDLAGGGNAFPVTDAQIQRDFGAAMAARPALPERYRLYFQSRSTQLTPDSVQLITTILQRSQRFSALEVLVVGHTDTRGQPADNLALGLKRARTLAEMLVAKGIRAQGIEIASEGENLPLIPTAANVAEPRNRRVEVTLR